MISKEKFDEVEAEHGCGYWNVCWEHACPCAITTENKGLQENIYNSLVQEAKEVSESFEDDDIELPQYEVCKKCGNVFEEFELTCGLCFDCYEEECEGEEEYD